MNNWQVASLASGVAVIGASVWFVKKWQSPQVPPHVAISREIFQLISNPKTTREEFRTKFEQLIKKHGQSLIDSRLQLVAQVPKKAESLTGEEEITLQNVTALLLASMMDRTDIVEELITRFNANDTLINAQGWRAIHLCILGAVNPLPTVKLFVEHDASLERSINLHAANPKNKWQPIHVALTKNNTPLVLYLLQQGADVNALTSAGQTPLMFAACNGCEEIVDELLKSSDIQVNIKTSSAGETALYYSCVNEHVNIVKHLLAHPAINTTIASSQGLTALHAVCMKGNLQLLKLLTGHPSFKELVNIVDSEKLSALHLCAQARAKMLEKADTSTDIQTREHLPCAGWLLEHGIDAEIQSCFGRTALHDAAYMGDLEVMVKLLVKHGASVTAADFDGLLPIHAACSLRGSKKGQYLEVIRFLIESGTPVNSTTAHGSSALHVAACAGEKAAEVVQLLLEAKVDYSMENSVGWTALHSAASEDFDNPELATIIRNFIEKHNPDFLKTFDPHKPRNTLTPSKYHGRMSAEERAAVLGGKVNLEGIAEKIRSGSVKNVIVLTGAGISVSAGIPDFRSTTGLYSAKTKSEYSLPNSMSAFDLSFFVQNPKPLYGICKDVFLPVVQGKFKPTSTHNFIRKLHEKGILLRNYSQNVDMLESVAGIPQDLIVESHGTFSRAFCMECSLQVENMMENFWSKIEKDVVPTCSHCGGLIRPDIVFLGEPLPSRFVALQLEDFRKCDLLIVMGTSLIVYPFAGLVNQVSESTPRLLINKQAVGPWKNMEDEPQRKRGISIVSDENYRDVFVMKACDEGVQDLMKLLDWTF